MTVLSGPGDVARISRFLADHPSWSIFWDKRSAVWRAAEDDPDSDLYAESSDADTVMAYITAHAQGGSTPDRNQPRHRSRTA
jgi:hypothetical protein